MKLYVYIFIHYSRMCVKINIRYETDAEYADLTKLLKEKC